jgi:hypothetical protein
MRRLVMAIAGVVVTVGTVAYSVSNHDAHGVQAQVPVVCFRDGSCVPAGSTAVPIVNTPGPRPSVEPTVVPSVTVTREPQPTQEPTPAQVCFRDGSCVPWGSQ